jgi:glucose-6-phosphate isomerase
MPDFRRRAARESMTVKLDANGAMAETIGAHGVSRAEIDALRPRIEQAARDLRHRRQAGEIGFYELHTPGPVLDDIKGLASELRSEFDTLVVLGIGGSALGTRTLLSALPDGSRQVIVADNVDPSTFGRMVDELDLEKTVFNVISKSGSTAETMAQFLVVRDMLLRAFGAVDYVKHVVLTTDAEKGALRQIVHDEGFRSLVVPDKVGGRFSVLTAVGLLPAAFAGFRIDELLAGAKWMDDRCTSDDVWANPAHLFAALLYLADTGHHQNIVALMPYSDRLLSLSAWFAQLWAESLGKAQTVDGRPAHVGQTPIVAVGATDQHSLLQLFAEGPFDKVVVMIRVEDHGREIPIPSAYGDLESLAYLGGAGLGELLNLEQLATEVALGKAGRPVMTIRVPQVNAFTVGQLFHFFEAAVSFAGGLYEVDPFDQPGVEESKRLTYAQMGREGYDGRRADVEAWVARKRDDLIV